MQFNFISYIFKAIMEVKKGNIQHILLYALNKGNNAAKSMTNINAEFGVRKVSKSQCQRYFRKNWARKHSLENEHSLKLLVELEEDTLQNMDEKSLSNFWEYSRKVLIWSFI